MEWSGSQIFNETALTQFKVDGKEAGLLKTYGPLTFLKVSSRMIIKSICLLPSIAKSKVYFSYVGL